MIFNIVCSLGNGNLIGGQITKTNEIINYIKENGHDVIITDLFMCKRKPFIALNKIIRGNLKSDVTIIILASKGYIISMPFIYFFNRKKPIYEFVVGGIRYKYLRHHYFVRKLAQKLNGIYVQTNYNLEQYKKMGFTNVQLVPNFKTFKDTSINMDKKGEDNILRICTLSRIDHHKGINIAIKIAQTLHEYKEIRGKFILDIYGPIDLNYKSDFDNCMKEFSEETRYCGIAEREKVIEIMSQYDIYLFPSEWEAEGFPNTLIDAMASGNIILANYNVNYAWVVKEGHNGWLIQKNNIEEYVKAIIYLYRNKGQCRIMQNNSIKEAENYRTEVVLRKLLDVWSNNNCKM
ncbi:MAG: glycosyltransferase family 4 protein [Clostridiales bacterium]|nr:glycosyltransferase family 4 protein [Clostridiales bacterium]